LYKLFAFQLLNRALLMLFSPLSRELRAVDVRNADLGRPKSRGK